MKNEKSIASEDVVNPPTPLPKMNLVDLDREYRNIVSEIEAAGGELTPESEAQFERAEAALCTKVDAYGVVSARLEQEIAYWKVQKEHCMRAERTLSNALVRLKERMKFVLSAHPDKSLQGDVYRFYLRKGKDTVVINEADLPGEYKTARIELTPDKEKIETDLKAGKVIPGAGLKTDNFSLYKGKPQ